MLVPERRFSTLALALGLSGCTVEIAAIVETGDEADALDEDDEPEPESEGESGEPLLDMPSDPPVPTPYCQVPAGELDGLPYCDAPTPGELLAPTLSWTWTGPGSEVSVVTTPLVGNLDDDNDDGFIDLCDTPDVLVAAVDLPAIKTDPWPLGHLHVIDGATGTSSRSFEHPIDAAINPALADLDGDGRMEIVALEPSAANSPYAITPRRLVAFDAEGNLLWQGDHWQSSRGAGAIAIADLEGDGTPEILAPEYVTDHQGKLLWALEDPPLAYSMPVAVDLELDGDLELLFGGSAYDHTGALLFAAPMTATNRGSVAVGQFDGDPEPELYVQHEVHGILEHEGSGKALCPTNAEIATGGFPVAIRDLDGDGAAEIVFGYADRIYVLGVAGSQCTLRWSRKLDLVDAQSSGTMFDLLDDGRAELIYADQSKLRIFSDTGEVVFEAPRTARDEIANPIVADVDGDGAAEILVASSEPLATLAEPPAPTPTLMLIENLGDDFAGARRIWNQHAYTSGIGTELGIPVFMAGEPTSGFRTNARLAGSPACIPNTLDGSD